LPYRIESEKLVHSHRCELLKEIPGFIWMDNGNTNPASGESMEGQIFDGTRLQVFVIIDKELPGLHI